MTSICEVRMIADSKCSAGWNAFTLPQSAALSERRWAAAFPRFTDGLDTPDRVAPFELFQTTTTPPGRPSRAVFGNSMGPCPAVRRSRYNRGMSAPFIVGDAYIRFRPDEMRFFYLA